MTDVPSSTEPEIPAGKSGEYGIDQGNTDT